MRFPWNIRGKTEEAYQWCVLTSLALSPAVIVLLAAGSVAGWIGLASLLITMAYHGVRERHLMWADCLLAWTMSGATTCMVLWTRHVWLTALGIAILVPGLVLWRKANRDGFDTYHVPHGLWHLLSGAASLCIALGYIA